MRIVDGDALAHFGANDRHDDGRPGKQ